jgi:putative transposase
MQTVHIYRLKLLDRRQRSRMRAAQQEAASVWMYCLQLHRAARAERTRWPSQVDLQRATKGGQFALHSQSIQLVCQQFLANVQAIKRLRQSNPRHRYPYRPKKYMTVCWPAQAISRQGKQLILPMGRGRPSLSFHVPDLPPAIGAVSLVWRGGYELHIVVPTVPEAQAAIPADCPVHAAVDLGEIHQAAVTTSTGQGLIVTGRGIRSLKRQHNKLLGRLSRLQSRCKRGSKRWRRLQYTRAREGGKQERRVRDLRHKGTRQGCRRCTWVTRMGCATRTKDAITTSAWRSGSTARTNGTCTRSVNGSASCASVAVSEEPAATVRDVTGSRSREVGTGPVGVVAFVATGILWEA